MNGRKDVLIAGASVASTLLEGQMAKRELRRAVRNWVADWGRRGVMICLTLRMTSRAAPSLMSCIENTESESRKHPEELNCE